MLVQTHRKGKAVTDGVRPSQMMHNVWNIEVPAPLLEVQRLVESLIAKA
jgi:hypothetical protein